jgi:hypothetical protein
LAIGVLVTAKKCKMQEQITVPWHPFRVMVGGINWEGYWEDAASQ